jgi:hypothetical protein
MHASRMRIISYISLSSISRQLPILVTAHYLSLYSNPYRVITRMTQSSSLHTAVRTRICVYCGASPGASSVHMEAARNLAQVMAANNIDLGQSPAFFLCTLRQG